jgi:2'-5' RNA ligase
MNERTAIPWPKTESGENVNLFLEALSKSDAEKVVSDLASGKEVSLPAYQGYSPRVVSMKSKDPSKRIDPDEMQNLGWKVHPRGNLRSIFRYTDGEYVPLFEGASPTSVLAKVASVLKGRVRKAIESGKPVVFLGGDCSGNEWREEIQKEFGDKLAFVDPYDEDWKADDNIYDELTALLKADHVVFYKGGNGTEKEKEFLEAVGDAEDFKSFDDLGKLKVYLENLSKPTVKTAKEDGTYKRCTTQVDLPEELAKRVTAWGKEVIPDGDLVEDEKGSMGREDEIHVTVFYGIEDPTPDSFRGAVEAMAPFDVRLGLVTLFRDKKDHDVVKIDAEAPELHKLHDLIKGSAKAESSFPTYVPHITIAYVKKAAGDKVLGSDEFRGETFKVNSLVFKDTDKNEIKIPMKGKS